MTFVRNLWEGLDFLLEALTLKDLPLSAQVKMIYNLAFSAKSVLYVDEQFVRKARQ